MSYKLTVEEFEKLKRKEKSLDEEEKRIADSIKNIKKNDFDFLNNLKYQELKRQLNFEIPLQREQIQSKLSNAEIIKNTFLEFDGKTVAIGTKVKLDYGDEIIEEYTILPVEENDFENKIISCNTPIAELIIGKEKGSVVTLRGNNIKILDVTLA